MNPQEEIRQFQQLEARAAQSQWDAEAYQLLAEACFRAGLFSERAGELYSKTIELLPSCALAQRGKSVCMLIRGVSELLSEGGAAPAPAAAAAPAAEARRMARRETLEQYRGMVEEFLKERAAPEPAPAADGATPLSAGLPESPDLLKALGDLFLMRGAATQAQACYQRALSRVPESPDGEPDGSLLWSVYDSFGLTAGFAERLEELPEGLALLICDALRHGGHARQAYEFTRDRHRRSGQANLLDRQIRLLEDELLPRAAPIDAHDYRAQLCELYLERGDVLESHRVFREMAPERPVNAGLIKVIARRLIEVEDYRSAFDCLMRVAVDEDAKNLLHGISIALEQRGELDTAAYMLEYVKKHDVVMQEAEQLEKVQMEQTTQRELGDLHFKTQRFGSAADCYLRSLELGAGQPNPQADREEVLPRIDASLMRVERPGADLLERAATYCLSAGEHMRAALYYSKALQALDRLQSGSSGGSSGSTGERLAAAARKSYAAPVSEVSLAANLRLCYTKLLEEDPESPELLVRSAELHLRMREHTQAIEQLEQASGNPYREKDAKARLLEAYRRGGRLRAAYRLGREIPIDAELLPTLFALQRQLAAGGSIRQAAELARRIYECDPEYHDAEMKTTVGQALQEYEAQLGSPRSPFPPDRVGRAPGGATSSLDGVEPADTRMVELIGGVATGRYRYVSKIGTGGMGEVHKVYDLQKRYPVAIKILRQSLSSSRKAVDRFFREARIVATLNHPNIVNIQDYNINANPGQSYIAMEYVDGPSLRDIIEKRLMRNAELTPEYIAQVLHYTAQLCDALEATHAKGIIHRDIKPDNVLVNARDEVKITDFGIVHIEEVTLTPTGAMIGTPRYMSPEQVKGQRIDGRSDIYGVGIILYEMFTGAPPFVSGDIAYQQVNQVPPPPSKLAPMLPQSVDALVMKCLAKNADERYQRAADLKLDAEDVLARSFPNFVPPHAGEPGTTTELEGP